MKLTGIEGLKRLRGATLLVAVGVLLGACGGAGEPGISGTWQQIRPGASIPTSELEFGPGSEFVLRRVTTDSSGAAAGMAVKFQGTYSVVGDRVTFAFTDSGLRKTRTTSFVIAGDELAVAPFDDDDVVLVSRGGLAAGPVGRWALERSTAELSEAGAVERSNTIWVEAEVSESGAFSWTAQQESVNGTTVLQSRVTEQGAWREVSPGWYAVKTRATDTREIMMRRIGEALVKDNTVFVRR